MTGPFNSKSGRTAGFTLVELLLAITLMSILLALTYGGLRAATRSSVQGEKILAATGELRATHQFLRRQLNQMLPLAYTVADGNEELRIVFEGETRSIKYVAPMPGYLGVGGPQVQLVELMRSDNGESVLQFSHSLLQGFEEEYLYDRDPVILLEGVTSAEFEFLGMDEQGELSGWTANWDQPGTLPVAVRLNVEFSEGSNLNWPELVAGVKVDETALQAGGGRRMDGRGDYQKAIRNMIKGRNREKQ